MSLPVADGSADKPGKEEPGFSSELSSVACKAEGLGGCVQVKETMYARVLPLCYSPSVGSQLHKVVSALLEMVIFQLLVGEAMLHEELRCISVAHGASFWAEEPEVCSA